MSLSTCVVSGTIRDLQGTGVSGVSVKANTTQPFLHTEDNSLVINYEASTSTTTDGTWSLSLVRQVTPNNTMTISFYYPAGSVTGNLRKEYTIQVPNSSTATFASLIGTQV